MAPHVFPAEETASLESGHILGKVLEQPRLFSKAMATFMPQLLQKIHEFISAKLTCNKKHALYCLEGKAFWAAEVGVTGSWSPETLASSELAATRDWG